MTMPRLLIVSTVSSMIEGFLLPFGAHFRRKGWTVDALANGISRSADCVGTFDRVWDIEWSRNPLAAANLSRSLSRVRKVAAEGRYDIVHVHTPIASLVTRAALRSVRARGGLRVIYTAHGFHFTEGGPPLRNTVFRTLERIAARWTDYLVVINRSDERAAHRFGVLPASQIVYIPGIGLDTRGKYHPSSVSHGDIDRIRRELRLDKSEVVVLMIAEFNPGKRHVDALSALTNVPEWVHLAFAGEGPLQYETARFAAALGLQDRVHFLGVRRDIPALICASAATLLPSGREGLPRSVLESMSLGVPVIATDIRGSRDLLEGGAGILVPVGDVDAIARAIRSVCNHPQEAVLMAQAARERAPAYDIAHVIRLHEQLYDRALGVSTGDSEAETYADRIYTKFPAGAESLSQYRD
jgi:glycosyltransferase involved in cell wall biosynthesis